MYYTVFFLLMIYVSPSFSKQPDSLDTILSKYQVILNDRFSRNNELVLDVDFRFDPLSSRNEHFYNTLFVLLLKANHNNPMLLLDKKDNLDIKLSIYKKNHLSVNYMEK